MKRTIFFLLFLALHIHAFSQNKTEVFFAFDRYDLEPEAQQKLDSWMVKNPKAEISGVYGYCDRIGTLEYNDSLSVKRARTVAEYLKMHEFAFADNFQIKGYGESFLQSKVQGENRKVVVSYGHQKSEVVSPVAKTELSKSVEKAKIGEKVRIPNLNFYNMSDQIVPKSRPVLDELLKLMNDNPNLKIEIQGHICCQVDKEKDYSYVSTNRAKAIYDYLLRNGISNSRISYKGFGVSRPLHPIPEKNAQEQDENRRVEIEIIGN